ETARQRGCEVMVALSTQAFRFFEEKMGYTATTPDALPTSRRERYEKSGRNSKILVKNLK
ncbi:MAG: amino-acid N-acetyltransferase, partial [bacterium]